MSSQELFDEIDSRMESMDTQELLTIWKENNRARWSDQAFEATKAILIKRGVAVPLQNEAKYAPPLLEETTRVGKALRAMGGRVLLSAFLVWAVILSPLDLLGFGYYPMGMLAQRLVNLDWTLGVAHDDVYLFLWRVLTYLMYAIVCYGIYAGITLLRRKPEAIARAKVYLLCLVTWGICALLLKIVYPFAESLWDVYTSAMDLRVLIGK